MRRFLFVPVLLMLAAAAAAADAELEQLAAQALALNRAAMMQAPDAGRLKIYVGHGASDLLLREVVVREGSAVLARHRFDDRESAVLVATAGLHRLATLTLADGEHALQIDVSARGRDDGPNDSMRRAHGKLVAKAPAAWVLELSPGRFGLGAGIGIRELAAGDIAQREAAFLAATDRRLEAAAILGAETLPAEVQTDSAAVERYNLALERLQQDQQEAGIRALEQLGRAETPGAAGLRLRDLANVTAGFARLSLEDWSAAAADFERVTAAGLDANRALLGLGWARLGDGSDAGARRALVPWLELVGRDPLDPSVPEGMLAISQVLRQLGAQAQSEDFCRRAVQTLGVARRQLQQAREVLQARDWQKIINAEDATMPAALRLALDAAAPVLRRYQRLSEMQVLALTAQARRGQRAEDAPLLSRLQSALDVQGARLGAALAEDLDRREAQLQRYLALAHLALARAYDREAAS